MKPGGMGSHINHGSWHRVSHEDHSLFFKESYHAVEDRGKYICCTFYYVLIISNRMILCSDTPHPTMQTRMQEMVWDGAEIQDLFRKEKRLDKQDMVQTQVILPAYFFLHFCSSRTIFSLVAPVCHR